MANSDKKHPTGPHARAGSATEGKRGEASSKGRARHGGVPNDELADLFLGIGSGPEPEGRHDAGPTGGQPSGEPPALIEIDTAGVEPNLPLGSGADERPRAASRPPTPPPLPTAGDTDPGADDPTTIEIAADEPEVFAEATLETEPDTDDELDAPVLGATAAAVEAHEPHRPPPPPPPRPPRQAASASRAPSGPASRPPQPPPDAGTGSALDDNGAFRREALALARARDWQKLAALTSAAIDHATWVALPETRAALLLDLARIHRDRLGDPAGAEEAFRRLAQVDPTSEDALEFLSRAYRARGDWRAVYDLFSAAVEPSWDPNQRLQWTRDTAEIATNRLRSPDLAIEAWERLERLGDAAEEAYRALSEMYRRARRFDRLAQFLGKRAAHLEGTERIVALREVAEAYLSGLRDHERAGEVLEQILALRPEDPIASLAYARVVARRADWRSLAELGKRPMEGVPPPAVLELRHAVASALWGADRRDEAMEVFERVLEINPDDGEALAARERYLSDDPARTPALIDFVASRIDRAAGDEARADLLRRVAELAEERLDDPRRAAELWEQRVRLPIGQLESHRALERLYERLGDLPAVARSLEGQLALTRNAGARAELLRRLGDHSAHAMGDDERAEACWKELVSILPGDRHAQEELLALHRRRGDFEALDQALAARAFRAADRDEVLECWRTAARNVEENLHDPARAVAAWNRVLDLAPRDDAALAAQVAHRRALGSRRELIAAVEAELGVARDPAARRARALEVASLWEGEGARVASLAAYERVLCWDPRDDTALAGLERLYGGSRADVGSAIAALEVAASGVEPAERIALLRRLVAHIDPGDKLGRFYALRRILWLSRPDAPMLAEIEQAAEEAGAWGELAEVYRTLAAETTDREVRAAHHRTLARLYEQRLNDPARAFLVLQASHLGPVSSAEALGELQRLAQQTGRHEDLLAVLEASAGAELPLPTRQAVLRQRVEVLERRIKDGARAFGECVRLLHLDSRDGAALDGARRLAGEHGLWRALDALHAELWDRATTVEERIGLALERRTIREARLSDAAGALDMQLVAYRLDPAHAALSDGLLRAAGEQRAWDRVLPVVEARVRALGDEAPPEELARLGALHEQHRGDRSRAFELYSAALLLRPDDTRPDDTRPRDSKPEDTRPEDTRPENIRFEREVRRLAEADAAWTPLAATFRVAAARAGTTERKLELLRHVAELAATRLQDGAAALDAHRLILQLDPTSLSSLEPLIEHHRQAGEWRDLRDRLEHWLRQSPDAGGEAAIARWLEIARVSRDRLADYETALSAIEKVLQRDPAQPEALAAVRSLEGAVERPSLELRLLRIELAHAEGPRRAEIQLACGRIESELLEDRAAAIETLRALVKETGAQGPGFEPLAALLRATGGWLDLATLIEARTEHLADRAARVAALEQAVAIYEEHLPDAPAASTEQLFKRLLVERPQDAETRRHLLSLYRDAGRYDELVGALRETLAAPGLDADERRQLDAELYRVTALTLGAPEGNEPVAREADDAEGLLVRARQASARGDFPAWLEARLRHARGLPPRHAALVLCHLAEACDELPAFHVRTAGLYREARTLDPQNPHAMEALKAIGRRARTWRPAAALLPEPGEAKLPHAERSRRLVAIAEAALQQAPPDGARASDYLLRAISVDPDNFQAWDLLADVRATSGDHGPALEARAASFAAYERSVAPAQSEIGAYVARIQKLAAAARAAGEPERAARLSLQAHRMQPGYPAAALAVADELLERGDERAALALFDRTLRGAASAASLDEQERLHALYRRGALTLRAGNRAAAIGDLQAALEIDALHGGVLKSLADALDGDGRVGAAATHYLQALLVEPEARGRGQLYARLGRLLEDKLGSAEEAGVCYDLSIGTAPQGEIGDRELLSRALAHYRHQGHPERALAVIARILPFVEDPREQASLWTEQGSILASVSDEDRAIEAFDMALSYDPGNRGAITGLSRILERRGDWEQLAQIFEARTETGSPEERAEALRALARMALVHLKDPVRAERYLYAVIELAPTREDYEQLLAMYGDDPAREEGRMQVLSGLLALGGPFMPRVIQVGKGLLAHGDRRWAWCVLSPLMNSTLSEPQLKATVLELRKEFEKSDNSAVLSPVTHEHARPAGLPLALLHVLKELDLAVTLGRATVEAASAGGTGRLDERTAVGKNFAAMASRLGLDGTLLTRAQDLPEPYVVLDGERGHVVVRAELLQLLSVAETAFLFASLLEQTRPGIRLLASLRAEERGLLVPALRAACGLGEAPAGGERLAAAIRDGTSDEQRTRWGAELVADAAERPAAGGLDLYATLLDAARRVGLVAAADLRFAARVITRLDESLPKMQTVGRIDDLDDFIANTPPVRSLLGFAVTPLFGKLLHGAV